MKQGSTLNFKKESAAFARALQQEHAALGDLLDRLVGVPLTPEQSEIFNRATTAHDAVRFQRTRTEAARGR